MAQYKIYGTNEPYSGKVIKIDNTYFTTNGGALEGHSKQVVKDGPNTGKMGEDLAIPYSQSSNNGAGQSSNTISFTAPPSPRYYRPNGTLVPVGTKLHRHTNSNKIMTGNKMTSKSVEVTLNKQSSGGNTTRSTSQNQNNRMNQGSGGESSY